MELDSLHYFGELCKDLNMTKTASRLFISQQTLSNHIQRIEKYYGAQLFYRKPTLSLTYTGELVLSFAQTIEKEHMNLRSVLSDIEQQERGVIRIGASMSRGLQSLSLVLPEFSKRYPLVEIRYTDQISSKLESMVLNGELDFAIALTQEHNPNLISHKLIEDQVYLCVPEQLLQHHYGWEQTKEIKARSLQGANIKDFERIPFSVLTNRLGIWMHNYFSRADFEPNVYFTGTYSNQTFRLCSLGLAACYCTHMCLVENMGQLTTDVNVFFLLDQEKPIFQGISLIRHKQRYLARYAKYFMDILFQSMENVEQTQVVRIVDAVSPGCFQTNAVPDP